MRSDPARTAQPHRIRHRGLRPAAVALALTGTLPALAGCSEDGGPASYRIVVQHSAFAPSELTIRAGRPVVVEIANDDPIDHEWIVGDDATHQRHRTGSEPTHDEQATEVSVPAGQRRVTRVTFDRPGDYRFVCHLPGHEAYGMVGVLHVV